MISIRKEFICDLSMFKSSVNNEVMQAGWFPYHTVPGHAYKHLVPILSSVTDNLLFLNQVKREKVFFLQPR